ncbi:MAG: methyltransferase domain-containing protein [Gammaproteobacteria bacterium]|nr:methyltransferase domain-containing protein [Gammaproteobacteria bacterium]
MPKFNDLQIIRSWQKNVRPWVKAIQQGEIESRVTITNKAIVDAVLQYGPKTVLDIGCGEGWLVRELTQHGVAALGIDVVEEFIDIANQGGYGRFLTLAYEDISADNIKETFDVVACNFSLLGKESVEHVFQQVPSLLNRGGAFIVQTLHPVAVCGDQAYADGWREGSWAGFSDQFTEPAPWYFRTIESWKNLFMDNGMRLVDIRESLNLETQLRASIIFIAEETV